MNHTSEKPQGLSSLKQPGQSCKKITNPTNAKKVKRKDGNPVKDLARFLLDNQTGFSFSLIVLLLVTHFGVSDAWPYTSKFFILSRYNANTGKYAASNDDFYFMSFCIILFTGLRAGFMEHVFAPLARSWGLSGKKVTRFSEQAWGVLYYNLFWPLGMYIYYKSPYFLNLEELWTDWPQRELDGLMKGYILAQWSFYLQLILVIQIEERRKDYWQMLTHHFVTVALIYASYAYHQVRVAHLILMLMDFIDLTLPLAKCLKYLGFSTVCDVLFGIFIMSWFVTRHVFYPMICWSVYSDLPRVMTLACYKGTAENLEGPFPRVLSSWSHLLDPFRHPTGTVCFDKNIMLGFLFYLLFLQAIMIRWFFLIVRVAISVVKGDSADDVRSDDEEEEGKELESVEELPFEEEVGVEAIDLKAWERRTGAKRLASSSSNSSGVNLPGNIDREILNRIGCDTKIN